MNQNNHQPPPTDEFLRLPQRDGTLIADLSVSRVARIVPAADPRHSIVVFENGGREFVLATTADVLSRVLAAYEFLDSDDTDEDLDAPVDR